MVWKETNLFLASDKWKKQLQMIRGLEWQGHLYESLYSNAKFKKDLWLVHYTHTSKSLRLTQLLSATRDLRFI